MRMTYLFQSKVELSVL